MVDKHYVLYNKIDKTDKINRIIYDRIHKVNPNPVIKNGKYLIDLKDLNQATMFCYFSVTFGYYIQNHSC